MIKFLDLKKINGKYSGEISKAIESVLENGWYLQGNHTKEFEKNYRNLTIVTPKGSVAEQFAKKYGIPYRNE